MKKYLLSCAEAKGKDAGQLIAYELDRIVNRLNLSSGVLKAITLDNATNMKVATEKQSNVLGLSCFDHTLQFVVYNSIVKTAGLEMAISAFNNLASRSHISVLYQQRIKSECAKLNLANPNTG